MTSNTTNPLSATRHHFETATCALFTEMKSSDEDNHKDRAEERGRNKYPGTPPLVLRRTLNRGIDAELHAQESVWLWASRHGVNANELATREGVSIRRVRLGLVAAHFRESGSFLRDVRHPPRLVPLFPLGPYTPQSVCRHDGPIEQGSLFCCMVCHRSGHDDHPALQRDPRFDQSHDGKLRIPLPKRLGEQRIRRETRKQRRQRLFGTTPTRSDSVRPFKGPVARRSRSNRNLGFHGKSW